MTEMNPYEYSKLLRDSKRENQILAWLRNQSEYEKFEFVWTVLKENSGLGLPLVKRAQFKKAHLEILLEYGLVYGDASTVRWWYEAVLEGLGEKKVISIIRSHIDDGPLIVEKMLYWLRPQNASAAESVKLLRKEFKEKYPDFNSTRSTGIHATGT